MSLQHVQISSGEQEEADSKVGCGCGNCACGKNYDGKEEEKEV